MSNAQIYEIDRSDAVAHLLSVVDADGENLSSMVLKHIGGGYFLAFAPPGVEYNRLRNFKLGGLVPSPNFHKMKQGRVVAVANLADKAAELVCQLANGLPLATVFIREPYLKPGDKSEIIATLSPIGPELYKIIALESCDQPTLIKEIRRFQVSWSFLLILSAVNREEREMQVILANASAIVVNAYDGESYLCWIRSSDIRP